MTIFLDIDGVLNTSSQWRRPYSLNNDCVREFCRYVKQVKGRVVLTSSWRAGFDGPGNINNTKQIKQLEAELAKYGISIYDKTPILTGRTRDKEIDRYLYFHPDNQYIIIDDDVTEYMVITSSNHFVDANVGFTRKDAVICRKTMRY